MKRATGISLTCLVIVVLAGDVPAIAQTHELRIPVSLGYQIHFERSPMDGPPSVGTFFGDAPGYSLGVMYFFAPRGSTIGYIAGFEYERNVHQNSYAGSEVILGNSIRFQSAIPFIGLGITTGSISHMFFHVALGAAIKWTSGSNSVNGLEEKILYDRGAYLSGLIGVDFERFALLPVSIGVGARFDFGTLSRGDIIFLRNGVQVAYAKPTGYIGLQDNTCTILLTTSYVINL